MYSTTSETEYLFKVLLVGESGVGKTCLLTRYADDKFDPVYLSTIGVDFRFRMLDLGDTKLKLQIWDTAGQERFRNITTSYYRGAHGVFLVYDVTDQRSFDKLPYWIDEIKHHCQPNIKVIIIGNKSDMASRAVSSGMGQSFAEKMGVKFLETSAKEASNVQEAFTEMAKQFVTDLGPKKLITSETKDSVQLKQDLNQKSEGCSC
eukprot:TRINITY_DN3768_c0_g1_i2.p1 TRINITY_DN3768_c0_g1~~TRINITY_DN3768_c0_g1_i2.p1  ORF type:complete len:205 (+),score=34.71 TRINITY_DN3768_c0_g1_i2:28-642(+)